MTLYHLTLQYIQKFRAGSALKGSSRESSLIPFYSHSLKVNIYLTIFNFDLGALSADRMKPLTQNYKQAILAILLVCINYLFQLIPFLYLFLHCRCLRMRFPCTRAVQAKVRETEGGWSCINTQEHQSPAHNCSCELLTDGEDLTAKAGLDHNTLEKTWSWYKRWELWSEQGMLLLGCSLDSHGRRDMTKTSVRQDWNILIYGCWSCIKEWRLQKINKYSKEFYFTKKRKEE